MWFHIPGFSEMASGGDSQRSGLLIITAVNQCFQQQLVPIEGTLELESIPTPDIFIGVHRVDRNQHLLPFGQAIYVWTRSSQIQRG